MSGWERRVGILRWRVTHNPLKSLFQINWWSAAHFTQLLALHLLTSGLESKASLFNRWKSLFFKFLLQSLSVCVYSCVHACGGWGRNQRTASGSRFFRLLACGSQDGTQVFRFGSKSLYQLSHPASVGIPSLKLSKLVSRNHFSNQCILKKRRQLLIATNIGLGCPLVLGHC